MHHGKHSTDARLENNAAIPVTKRIANPSSGGSAIEVAAAPSREACFRSLTVEQIEAVGDAFATCVIDGKNRTVVLGSPSRRRADVTARTSERQSGIRIAPIWSSGEGM
jgi:hypothetical protein